MPDDAHVIPELPQVDIVVLDDQCDVAGERARAEEPVAPGARDGPRQSVALSVVVNGAGATVVAGANHHVAPLRVGEAGIHAPHLGHLRVPAHHVGEVLRKHLETPLIVAAREIDVQLGDVRGRVRASA